MAIIPSVVPSKTLGGIDSTSGNIIVPANDTSYFTLYMTVGSSSTGNYYPFYKNGTQYRVTTGKTCRVECIAILDATTNNVQLQLVSSLTSFAQNASSITSGTYQGGAAGIYPLITGATNTWRVLQATYEFEALSYPGVGTGNSSQNYSVMVVCREI